MNKTQLFVIVGIVIFSIGISSVYATNTRLTPFTVSTDEVISTNALFINTTLANIVQSNITDTGTILAYNTTSTIINATHIGTSDITASNIYVSGTCTGCGSSPSVFTPTNVTGSRSINTVYQNTSGKSMLVNISVFKQLSTLAPYPYDSAFYTLTWDTANPPVEFNTYDGMLNYQDSAYFTSSLSGIVPDGYYYELKLTFVNTSGLASTGILQWIESS